jgi:tetratricopeptide (TPR) repeat protein
MKTNLRFFLLIVAAGVALFVYRPRADAQTATIQEERKTFRTYPFGDPNPVARMGNIYPYYRFEGYSATPVKKAWKVITLENPYIKVLIAPEIGGKILGAFEKSTGKPFIYFNNVVKFREIAMRGPWTSGGIEFNFGDIGHAPSTATPVDYVTRVNPDGSASCIVGTIDLPSQTEWRVEIRLPKDKAYVEAHSFWYNPTELSTSLYHWMNAAADADSDLFFIYPGIAHIDHGGLPSPWPVNQEGRDLSLYRNNAFGPSKSYHVLGTYTDFFGLGWKNRNFGVIHWADYVDKPGKKLWLWALSREGGIWTDLLTDTDLGNSQYVEFQSGLLFNQALPGSSYTPFKHRTFAPYSEERFTEAWLPFKDIGNVVQANPHALLNVEHRGSMLVFAICPLEKLQEELVVTSGSSEIYRRKMSMKPMHAFSDSVSVPATSEIVLRLGSLLEYRSTGTGERDLDRPREGNRAFDWNSVDGLAVDGTERARQRDYDSALQQFQKCLAKDSLYNPALVGVAEVSYRRMEYDTALAYVRKALGNDAYDPAANFLYGVIQRKRGRLYDAMDGFGSASRSTEYRSAASTALSEVALLQGRWEKALPYAERALDYDRYNIRALQARAVAFRKTGRPKDAIRVQEEILRWDPLSHFARMERYQLQPSEKTRHAFESAIQTELPAEVYLGLAAYYYDIGMNQDALQCLALAPSHPIIHYWRAYLHSTLGHQREADESLRKGAETSYHLVFPFRGETAEVLAWARSHSDHWSIRYYLALIFWNKGRVDDARHAMAECGNAPADGPFYVTRGNLFRGADDSSALMDYRQAVVRGTDEWRSYAALASFYNDHARYNEALNTLGSGAKRFPENYVLQFEYARTLLFNQRYRDCLAVLDTIKILPFEGAGYGRELHRQAAVLASVGAVREANYQEALALITRAREWPERLGVGKPYEVDSRIEDYLEGLCKTRTGDTASATRLFSSVVQHTSIHTARDAQYLLRLLALQKMGQAAEVTKSLEAWATEEPANPVAVWAAKTFHKDTQKPRGVSNRADSSADRQWNPIPSDPNFPMVKDIASISME